MFLEALGLNNFRSFQKERISFEEDLTILVGENNGGKSNAIDALRLCTTPLSGRRELYCETTDIRFGASEAKFELDATYAGLNAAQQGRLISAVTDHSLQKVVFGLVYDETKSHVSVRPSTWAGHLKSTPEQGCQDMIRHVYLPPLRDAKRALASGNPTRIYALLQHFLGNDKPQDLANRLKRNTSEQILKDIDGAVDARLVALTGGVRRQGSSLGFSSEESLIDIARDLRFKMADHGIEAEDLRYTGHGYANLLYMATIAVELENVKNADLTLFLVEEPEAHLHPQLQAAVLCFLEEQAEKSKKVQSGTQGPAGQLQVVVATHSPNLSAWVSSRKLVFFRSVLTTAKAIVPIAPLTESAVLAVASAIADASKEHPVSATTEPPATEGPELDGLGNEATPETSGASLNEEAVKPQVPRRSTRCIPLKELAIGDDERRKVDRYLDVTKSALLFGGRALLVEGIAETLLLPVIARRFVLQGIPEKYRTFRSAVFVAIDGVDFEPYLRLLLTPHNEIRLADRVVVVTDGDRTKDTGSDPTLGERRKARYDILAAGLTASSSLEVCTNTYSLETELVNAGNEALLKSVYLKHHPKSEPKWEAAVSASGDEKAASIQALFEDTPKGDFAQQLAELINNTTEFNVPAYLKTAIEAIVA